MDSGVMREAQSIGPGAGLRFELWWASAAGQLTLCAHQSNATTSGRRPETKSRKILLYIIEKLFVS